MSCSYCGDYEHNRVTCSLRKDRVGALRKEGVTQHYLLHEEDLRKESKEHQKKYAKTRTCSWCEEAGHNRRTCPDLKERKSEFLRYQVPFRREVFAAFKEAGIGVGTLVKYLRNEFNPVTGQNEKVSRLMVVINIDWPSFRWDWARRGRGGGYAIQLSILGEPGPAAVVGHFGISKTVMPESNTHSVEILSPLPSEEVENQRPDDEWFSGQGDLSVVFHKELGQGMERHWSEMDHVHAASYDFFKNVE